MTDRSTPRTAQIAAGVWWYDKYVKDPLAVHVTDDGRVRLIEPEVRTCRECGDEFESTVLDAGTKWTRSCQSCLQMHL